MFGRGRKAGAQPIEPGHSLVKYLSRRPEPLLLEEAESLLKDSEIKSEAVEFMRRKGYTLVVPSVRGKEVLGFIGLGPKPELEVYTEDDIYVFKILSKQAALAIENSIYLEEFQKAQEKLYQADKLATLAGMAQGVSHQINNRLQVLLMITEDLSDVLRRRRESLSGEGLEQDIDYCLKDLSRMEININHAAQIVSSILLYAAAEQDKEYKEIEAKTAVDTAVRLVKVKHYEAKGCEIEVEAEGQSRIYGCRADITDVLVNLLENSYDAIERRKVELKDEAEGRIKVNIKGLKDKVRIEIKDNGIGIKAENQKKIFAPFYTTKSSAISGKGLGMYVIKKIIEENHKGRIWFKSEYKKGAEFYIELPMAKKGL
ncbi:hypothetical protein DRQ26_04055 [bacterium]|nr:MAG: hypothetical protein DRQ26_04055 [bacterium]